VYVSLLLLNTIVLYSELDIKYSTYVSVASSYFIFEVITSLKN
jgi:hypothetical protein